MKSCLLIIPSIFIMLACGSSKQLPETTSKTKTVAAKDFPYIESFHNGVRLNMRQDYDGARKAFEYCLSIRQNDDAVYYGLSQVEYRQNNIPKALDYIQKASNLDPKNIWYTEETAALLYDNQQFDKAIPYFKKLVAYEPQNVKWLYGYADCLLRNGKIDETLKVLDQTEAIIGKSPELIGEKYNILMNAKREDLALQEIQKGLVDFPNEIGLIAILVDHYFKKGNDAKAYEYLDQLQKADPENGRANIALGDFYLRKKDYNKAFDYFIKGFPSKDVEIDIKMNLILSLQETRYVTDNRLDTLLAMLIEHYPTEAKAYTLTADQAVYDKDMVKALQYYRKGLQFEKNIYPIWQQAIIFSYEVNDMQALYDVSTECKEYFPSTASVYYFNAISAIELNKPDEAIEAIESANALLPSTDVGYIAELDAQKGVAYFLKKNYTEGYKFFKSAMAKDPNSNLVKSIFALQMARHKLHLDEAQTTIERAIKTSPEIGHYYFIRGMLSLAKKDYSKATADIEKALTTSPEERFIAEYNERLGDAYFQLGDSSKAVEYWQKAKDLGRKSETLIKKINSKTYYEEPL